MLRPFFSDYDHLARLLVSVRLNPILVFVNLGWSLGLGLGQLGLGLGQLDLTNNWLCLTSGQSFFTVLGSWPADLPLTLPRQSPTSTPCCPGLAGPERAQVSQASPSPSLHYIVFHQPACLTSQQSILPFRNGREPAVPVFCMDFPWTPINNQSWEESRPLLVSHGSIKWMLNGSSNMIQK